MQGDLDKEAVDLDQMGNGDGLVGTHWGKPEGGEKGVRLVEGRGYR